MSPLRPPLHPMVLQTFFYDWLERSGALSALPDAPVIPDVPRRTARARRFMTALRRTWHAQEGRDVARAPASCTPVRQG